MNVVRLLGHLRRHGARSRSDLAFETGMTKAAVTTIVGDLLEFGLVAEGEAAHTGQSGRPSKSLAIAGSWVHGIGIEIGSDSVQGAIVDLSGAVLGEVREKPWPTTDVDLHRDEFIASLEELIGELLQARSGADGAVVGACLAAPGWMLCNAAPTRSSPDPRAFLVDRLRGLLPAGGLEPAASVERSANLSSFAERRRGLLEPSVNLVTLLGGLVVEAGLLVDGNLVAGATDCAADLGHLVVDPRGHRCRCGGRGCWETMIGVEAVLRECAPDLAGNPLSLRHPGVIDEVVARATSGDEVVLEGLQTIGFWLGVGLASTVATLNPGVIHLAGSFAALAPWLLGPARQTFTIHARGPAAEEVEIDVSPFDGRFARGRRSTLVGAGFRATEAVLDDPVRLLFATGRLS